MTDFETMVEMFTRAGIDFYQKRILNGTSYVGLYNEETEFYFDENGTLIGN